MIFLAPCLKGGEVEGLLTYNNTRVEFIITKFEIISHVSFYPSLIKYM